ncbi:MAG: nucleotidyltransferase family protein [Deltaproteobacteria bacterium]|nr:nucleotidyltransferase family protein [Deltaproteobacteria bacterium]
MRKINQIKQTLEDQEAYLKRKYKIKEFGVFGSYARGEQSETSDLDILVDFEEVPSLFELVELEDELSELLGVKTDIVMKSGLKPRIGSRILKEVVLI